MPDFTITRESSMSVRLLVPFDAQWDHFEVWSPDPVADADVPAYFKLRTEAFPNVDMTGNAELVITYDALGTKGAHGVYIRVVGKRGVGDQQGESVKGVNSTFIDRLNHIVEEAAITVLDYPPVAQFPFGFDAKKVKMEHISGTAELFFSYNGKDDHYRIGQNVVPIIDEAPASAGMAVAQRVFVRVDASAGGTARITADRPDIDRR